MSYAVITDPTKPCPMLYGVNNTYRRLQFVRCATVYAQCRSSVLRPFKSYAAACKLQSTLGGKTQVVGIPR